MDDQQTTTGQAEPSPWRRSRELLDRIEADGWLDGGVIVAHVYGGFSGGLSIGLQRPADAEALAAHLGLAAYDTHSPKLAGWGGTVDGINVDVTGWIGKPLAEAVAS